jgi:hypothetical protein
VCPKCSSLESKTRRLSLGHPLPAIAPDAPGGGVADAAAEHDVAEEPLAASVGITAWRRRKSTPESRDPMRPQGWAEEEHAGPGL